MMELTSEDRMTLADLVTSKGWEIFTHKVLQKQREHLREACCTNPNDVRYAQGFYAGFNYVEQLAIKESKPEEDFKYVLPANPMDLMSRKGQ